MPEVRALGRLAITACGAALFAAAIAVDAAWFARHVVVPELYHPPWPWVLPLLRVSAALLGAALIAAAGRISRLPASPGGVARIAVAVLLALAASELLLRRREHGVATWREDKLEFHLGHTDPRYGWVLFPSRTTLLGSKGSTPISFAIDSWGDRAATDRGGPDPSRPSLVVAGESIGIGHGLPYEDTFAAQLAGLLGLQLVNVSAGGYGTDQSLLRLQDALPRLRRPVATVLVFLPVQLARNVQDYRPRLTLRGGTLALVPAAEGFFARLRLRDLLVNELPVLGEAKLRESLAVTAAVVREAARVSRARGAEPVFLVPVVGPPRPLEAHREAPVLRELFVDQQLPFVLADVERRELVSYDGHPNAAASRRIAEALEAALRPRLVRAQ